MKKLFLLCAFIGGAGFGSSKGINSMDSYKLTHPIGDPRDVRIRNKDAQIKFKLQQLLEVENKLLEVENKILDLENKKQNSNKMPDLKVKRRSAVLIEQENKELKSTITKLEKNFKDFRYEHSCTNQYVDSLKEGKQDLSERLKYALSLLPNLEKSTFDQKFPMRDFFLNKSKESHQKSNNNDSKNMREKEPEKKVQKNRFTDQ